MDPSASTAGPKRKAAQRLAAALVAGAALYWLSTAVPVRATSVYVSIGSGEMIAEDTYLLVYRRVGVKKPYHGLYESLEAYGVREGDDHYFLVDQSIHTLYGAHSRGLLPGTIPVHKMTEKLTTQLNPRFTPAELSEQIVRFRKMLYATYGHGYGLYVLTPDHTFVLFEPGKNPPPI